MHQLYVLFENAAGYALFRTTEFEEIGIFLPQVQRSILDVSKFRSIVFLVAFHSFKKGEALENMKCISEGKLHMDLQLFLENNVPKSKISKQAVVLGVQESDLASSVTETLGITCSTSGVIDEILRGIRFHFHKLVKGYKDLDSITKAQQGLGHHYSRAKMNFNIYKYDGMITQNISMLDQLNKDINTLTLRVREWYSFHFPELIKIVPDNEAYIQCVKEIKDRNNMPENIEAALEAILQDKEKVQSIQEASHSSMGMDIAVQDIENIQRFINQIMSHIKLRNELMQYLKTKMHLVAPNLAALIGELVGARLISQAGSLNNLAKLPASTVQILGAGKSLFRTMKTKAKNTPKFDSLNQSTLIGKAGRTALGRISRLLANKCSLASKIDCFSVVPTNVHGLNLKQIVDDRRSFYENGKLAAEFNPSIFEEKRKAFLTKKALLRKRRKERKRKKQMNSNELVLKKPEIALTNETSEVLEEVILDDTDTMKKQPTRSKRKAKELLEIEENGEEPKPKKPTRKSLRNFKRNQ